MPIFDVILTRMVTQHAVILEIEAPTQQEAENIALDNPHDWYLFVVESAPKPFFVSQTGSEDLAPKEPK